MSADTHVEMRWSVLAGGAAVLLALGVGVGYVAFAARHPPTSERNVHAPPTEAATAPGPATAGPIVVAIGKEARARAGIMLSAVGSGTLESLRRMPAVVEPNAYRQVTVTPLASGRVTRVMAELGERVSQGQIIAELFSPELAEAEAGYVSARAELDAHDRELARVGKLVDLGSASRQELERVTAEHASRRTAVHSAAARLRLLGVEDDAIEHLGAGHAAPGVTLQVRAPLSGVVTDRPANVGLNVEASTPLLTIVDLSSVWVVANVYEGDFGRVQLGMPATVTASAYPGLTLPGRVDYIDPRVSPETRTAKARVEVPNPRHELRLGMLADVSLGTATGGTPKLTIPAAAVQTIADRSVVYVANPSNDRELIERTVRLGDASGDRIAVLAGLEPGEHVVVAGSFYVRAERERLGLGEPAPTPAVSAASPATATRIAPQAATVTITKDGFTPSKVTLRAGTPARLTFLRTTDETCAKEIVVPSLNVRRPLPLNEAVDVELTPQKAGTIEFVCGMAMLRGAIVIQ